MKQKTSVKLSDKNLSFLRKMAVNRVKVDKEMKTLPPSYMLDLIEKYFKLNNEEYIKLLHLEVKK